MHSITHIVAYILIMLVYSAQAQQKPLAWNKPLNHCSIDQWTTDQGLISNNLTSVTQSTDGFLWITSYNGLHRFDGYRFELFDRENISLLETDAFYRGYTLPSGKILFSTQGSGILQYDGNEFSYAIKNDSLLPKSIRCLLVNSENDFLAGSNNNGLFHIQDTTVIKINHDLLNSVSVMSLAKDSAEVIWIATNGNGIVRWDKNKFTSFNTSHGLLSSVVNTILISKKGKVFAGTTAGLNILENNTITTVDELDGIQIISLLEDQFGFLWVASERGLFKINTQDNTVEYLGIEHGLPTAEITSLHVDKEGSLWITTSKSGLIRLKDTGIVTLTEQHGLSMNNINIAVNDGGNKLWVGSDAGDIDLITSNEIHHYTLNNPIKNVGIRDILIDSKNNLWIGSYNGVIKKSGNNEKVFTTQNGLPAQDIRRILEDKFGRIWIATRSGGAIQLEHDKVKKVFNRQNGLASNYILAIEQDEDGTIYLGTNGGGLAKIYPSGEIQTFHLRGDDSGTLIFNIHINTKNEIYCISNTGVFYFDGKTFTQLQFTPTLKGETFFDWTEDLAGNIWISSNKGILQLTKTSVKDFLAQKRESIPFKLFDNYDGMKNRECTAATRSLVTQDGMIYIPTVGGLVKINPTEIKQNETIPPVYITNLITDSRTYKTNAPVEVEAGNLRYTISFTALSLLAPNKVEFKYMLEGFDNNWIDHRGVREVQYTNLKPGNYTFRVIASNNDGIWNEQGATFIFTVKPFFYQTTLFFILAFAGIITIILLVYKIRVYQIEKRNRELRKVNNELDKFVYSASHDLRAPLASVLGLINIARIDKDSDKENYLNLIEKSILKLDTFIQEIIDFSRNARLEVSGDKIHFENLIQDIVDNLKYLDEQNKIKKLIRVSGTGEFYTDEKRLRIILSNLIGNAIKYQNPRIDNSFVDIDVTYSSNEAIVRIIDNGVGIEEKHLENIFKMFYRATDTGSGSGLGLYIVKEAIAKIHGSVHVVSKFEEGSTFTVALPSLQSFAKA